MLELWRGSLVIQNVIGLGQAVSEDLQRIEIIPS